MPRDRTGSWSALNSPLSEMMTTDYQDRLMQHACGLSNNEKRNWFGTGSNSRDGIEFEKLVNKGLAIKRSSPSWSGDDVIFSLTDKGLAVAAESMPPSDPEKKLTKAQARYQRFLEYGDMFETFIDFCRWDAEEERSWHT